MCTEIGNYFSKTQAAPRFPGWELSPAGQELARQERRRGIKFSQNSPQQWGTGAGEQMFQLFRPSVGHITSLFCTVSQRRTTSMEHLFALLHNPRIDPLYLTFHLSLLHFLESSSKEKSVPQTVSGGLLGWEPKQRQKETQHHEE